MREIQIEFKFMTKAKRVSRDSEEMIRYEKACEKDREAIKLSRQRKAKAIEWAHKTLVSLMRNEQ